MATIATPTIAPDTVLSFDINAGTLLQFLETRAEGGPRLKCFEGSVTLVSPGIPLEEQGFRLNLFLVAMCFGLGIKLKGLASTTGTLPHGAWDTAHQADAAYHIRRPGRPRKHLPPDLVVEIVVSHPAKKAFRAGAFLKIPKSSVLDLPRRKLTFYHLTMTGKEKGMYRPEPRSRAFPFPTSSEVMGRLEDPETDGPTFQENCRDWVGQVLLPRLGNENGGA